MCLHLWNWYLFLIIWLKAALQLEMSLEVAVWSTITWKKILQMKEVISATHYYYITPCMLPEICSLYVLPLPTGIWIVHAGDIESNIYYLQFCTISRFPYKCKQIWDFDWLLCTRGHISPHTEPLQFKTWHFNWFDHGLFTNLMPAQGHTGIKVNLSYSRPFIYFILFLVMFFFMVLFTRLLFSNIKSIW